MLQHPQHLPRPQIRIRKTQRERERESGIQYIDNDYISGINSIFMADIQGFFTDLSPGFQVAPLNGFLVINFITYFHGFMFVHFKGLLHLSSENFCESYSKFR